MPRTEDRPRWAVDSSDILHSIDAPADRSGGYLTDCGAIVSTVVESAEVRKHLPVCEVCYGNRLENAERRQGVAS